MRALFEPKSVAIIGGTNDVRKPGGQVTHRIKERGGPRISVVNARGEPVQGLPTFASVEALPDAPELAIVAIPATHVLAATRQLLARGTRAFIVLSAGFSELGEEGRKIEAELARIVEEAGADLIGPNSLGVATAAYCGVFGGPQVEASGGMVDFISASGSTAAFIMEAGLAQGLRFSSLVSVGNSAMHGVESVLAYYDANYRPGQSARCKLLYLESVTDSAVLLHHARSLRAKGAHVVALKAGKTEVGMRAASSHTGALASRDAAVSALFRKAGICRVASRTQMVNVAGLLSCYGAPAGRRIAIVTHAGGPGIMLADELSARGFEVPELQQPTRDRLASVLPPGSATGNPVDCLAAATATDLRHIFEVLHEKEAGKLDAVCVIFGSPGLFDISPALDEIAAAADRLPIPVYPLLPSVRMAASEHERFRAAGHFYCTDERDLAEALGALVAVPAPVEAKSQVELPDAAEVAAVLELALGRKGDVLEPAEVSRILRAAGLKPPPEGEAHEVQTAVELAEKIGYPVTLKVVGPLHKTEHGGVVLGLTDAPGVCAAYQRLMHIPNARGVLVQRQVEGVELLVGLSHEAGFGHLLLFGLGGIFAEALGDVATALTPVNEEEARALIHAVRGAALLKGWRGRPAVDEEALVRVICAVSSLAEAFPQIREMDINPLIAAGDDLWAVDARILISR